MRFNYGSLNYMKPGKVEDSVFKRHLAYQF